MDKCENCNVDYKKQSGQEPELCTKCSLLVIKTKVNLLNSIKYALHSDAYYPLLQQFTKQEEKLTKKENDTQTSMDL